MGTSFNFWSSGIWLIPLALVFTLAGLFLLVRLLRGKTQANLKAARRELRGISSWRRQITRSVENHSVEDDEPYRTSMSELQQLLQTTDQQIEAYEREFIAIQEESRRLSWQAGLAVIGAPYIWYMLRRRSADLLQEVTNSAPILAQVNEASERVNCIAWEVALTARDALQNQVKISQILDRLTVNHVEGDALENAINQAEITHTSLEEIPQLFFEGDQGAVLRDAGKETVVDVHAALEKIQPRLDILLKQCSGWDRQYQDAIEQNKMLQAQLASAGNALVEPPPGLDLSTQVKLMDNLQVISKNLNSSLSRLEVSSLGTVGAETRRVLTASRELEIQVRQSRQELPALKAILPELSQDLKRLSMQFASLGTSSVRPLTWGQSRARFTSLNRQVNELGPAQRERTPEQLHQDLVNAQRLKIQLQELNARCQEVAGQHAELLHILSDPELADWQNWENSTQLMSERIRLYSPENWQRMDNVSNWESDLASLASRLDGVVGDSRSQPVEEDQLAETLAESRHLLEEYRLTRQRAASIQARLIEIQSLESQSRETLDSALTFFQQLLHLVRSNAFLTNIAGNEANRFQNELENLSDQFAQTEQATIDKKARQVENLYRKIEGTANGWVNQLKSDIDSQLRSLSERVASLDAIASLDESVVAQTRELLSAGPSFTSRGTGSGNQLSLEKGLLELKRLSDYWQQLAASRRPLEELTQPIFENYQAANESRLFARQQFQEISNWMRNTHGWPPTSVSFQAERQELGQLEAQWEALKAQRQRGMQLASQLGKLSAMYMALGDRLQRSAERAVEDQNQVSDMENEYADLVQMWQVQARTYSNNPLTNKEIRDLLERSERELSNIRQTYKQGTRNYNQVLSSMRILVRNLRIAMVAIDEEHTLEIQGRVTRAR